MSPRLATTASAPAPRTVAVSWVWRDASHEGLVAGALAPATPVRRGAY